MSDYKTLKGIPVKVVSGDPTALIGQVWYDSAASAFQVYRNIGAWASGGNISTAGADRIALGIQTAALAVSGNIPDKTDVEGYDGSAWSEA